MDMKVIILCLLLVALPAAFSQEYSIDITGIKNSDYSIGDEMYLKVILLRGDNLANEKVSATFSDALGKKKITKAVESNKEFKFKIPSDAPGGLWSVKAKFKDIEVERSFNVGENQDVEFILEGDELIIRNLGNVRYTRTVRIKIGDSVNSYVQNIDVGGEKRLKLISPTGRYDIEVSDGKKTIKRRNVQLFGTGNVIGAVDKNLVGYTGFAGAGDLRAVEDKSVSMSKLPLTLVFISAVVVLAVLVTIERRIAKKSKSKNSKSNR